MSLPSFDANTVSCIYNKFTAAKLTFGIKAFIIALNYTKDKEKDIIHVELDSCKILVQRVSTDYEKW